MTRIALLAVASVVTVASSIASSVASAGVTGFDGGTGGWGVFFSNEGGLGDFNLATGGNPGANLNFKMVDTFGVSLHNDSNTDVIGDYSRFSGGVKLGLDIKVNSIVYDPFFDGGFQVSRPLVAELIDNNPEGSDYPYTSVWYDFGDISLATHGEWTHLEVTINNVEAAALPAGWGGYGAEDSTTFEPILPAGRTFASVLDGVDEIRFTTFKPGWFFGFTQFDLQYDNITVLPLTATPEPTTLMLAAAALPVLGRRRRS
jgi:hypothetical protein